MSSLSDHRSGHASSSRSPRNTPPEADDSEDDLELQRHELLAEEDPLHDNDDVNSYINRCAYLGQQQENLTLTS